MNRKVIFMLLLLPFSLQAQTVKKLSLAEAIRLGIANSKNLKLSQQKIMEMEAKLETIKDNALPNASASFMYNHAEIPTQSLQIGRGNPINLPSRADAFVGTAGIQELIYGGNKLKYAKESTKLLRSLAELDLEKNKEEVTYAVINSYFSLYRLQQSKNVVLQNLNSIGLQLKQAQQFFSQGIVTKNDVLRFQLQQANVSLTKAELETNQQVVNYTLNILLGLPEENLIAVNEDDFKLHEAGALNNYQLLAQSNRQELKQFELREKVGDLEIKSIKADRLPTVGIGANLYYINPSGSFIPPQNQFIAPMTVGATVSWNIANLWKNKNKVTEANLERGEIAIQRSLFNDQLKTEINKNYQQYALALERISILQASIDQATENDRLLASKYKNNMASVTDRSDAETLLYQAKINLELAKADAGLAYYTLLKSTGKISK